MLGLQNVQVAKRLVAALEDHAIVPLDNSPVQRLAATSVPVVETPVGEVAEVVQAASMTENLAGVVEHDVVSEEIVSVLAAAVREHFNFARNVVKTGINTVVSAMEDAESNSGMPNYSIVSVRPAAVLQSPLLDDLIARFAGQPMQAFNLPKGLPDLEEPRLIELLKTGAAEFDQLLADLVASHPAGWVSKLYKKFFQEGRVWEPTYNLAAAERYVMVHLLAQNLLDNPPEMVGYSLEEYQLVMANTLSATGRVLTDILNTYGNYESSKVVVLEYPARLPYLNQVEDGEIKVYGPSYDNFLRAGGSPEIIFGACVQNRPLDELTLLKEAEQYTAAYLSAYKTAVEQFNQNRSQRLWVLLGAETSKFVQNCEPGVLNPDYVDPVVETQEAVKAFIAEFGVVNITENYYDWARDLFGIVVFGHTNASEILKGIDLRIAAVPTETPMEAAYHVAVKLVVRHLVSQNQITRL